MMGRALFWWQFHAWRFIRRNTFCRVGLHRMRPAWNLHGDLGDLCMDHEWGPGSLGEK